MALKDSGGRTFTHEDLTSFLDVVYGKGADPTFMDGNGMFATKIGQNELYTNEYYDTFIRLKTDFSSLMELKSDGYQYPASASISVQISDLVENDIYTKLSVQSLSGTGWVEDQFGSEVSKMKSDLDSAEAEFENLVSGDYRFYFESHQDSDTYILGNPHFKMEGLRGRVDDMIQFVSDNGIKNQTITDATQKLIDDTETLSARLREDVVSNISAFRDSDYQNFQEEIDYIQDGVN